MPTDRGYPDRLTIDQFMTDASHCLFRQTLHGHVSLHWHEFYELTFVLSGEGVNTVNGKDIPVRAGTLFLLTPADFHEIRPLPGRQLEIYNLIYREECMDAELRGLLLAPDCPRLAELDGTASPAIAEAFALIEAEARAAEPDVGSRLLFRGALDRILVALYRNAQDGGSSRAEAGIPDRHPVNIQNALLYIQHHFREPIALEDAARQSGLSSHYFSERFRLTTGTTFQQYLLNLRLQYARALLRASALPVSEICFVSGFNTLAHFEKMFKRRYGHPPNAGRTGRSPLPRG
ncbi:helix-turn-helix domain-containing protein [Cohnella nanjingensis]|uniref:AraC family transcriptional regulator n=1 Tax=Cohnella nanjingensis TaxID=1387779 RepID=A0A7X0RWK8_9BACL|nr:AraC family transcriptional regulator [Cohnella nanjingensis]MBB6674961.1 AraC family transcriptional regulator [Cohnella nanjingensis]